MVALHERPFDATVPSDSSFAKPCRSRLAGLPRQQLQRSVSLRAQMMMKRIRPKSYMRGRPYGAR